MRRTCLKTLLISHVIIIYDRVTVCIIRVQGWQGQTCAVRAAMYVRLARGHVAITSYLGRIGRRFFSHENVTPLCARQTGGFCRVGLNIGTLFRLKL